MVQLFHTTYISVDLARYKVFRAKVCKDGISTTFLTSGVVFYILFKYLFEVYFILNRVALKAVQIKGILFNANFDY